LRAKSHPRRPFDELRQGLPSVADPPDQYEHTFAKPVNVEHRRRLLDQQRRYFEALVGVPLEIVEIETGPRGEITVRWRPKT
jgi:hypothetical protein